MPVPIPDCLPALPGPVRTDDGRGDWHPVRVLHACRAAVDVLRQRVPEASARAHVLAARVHRWWHRAVAGAHCEVGWDGCVLQRHAGG